MQKKENLKTVTKVTKYDVSVMTFYKCNLLESLQNDFVDAGQIIGVIIDATKAQHGLAQHQHEEQSQALFCKVPVRVHLFPISEMADKQTGQEILCSKSRGMMRTN